MPLATALLARLATLLAELRGIQPLSAQDAAASRTAVEDPLALLRPLFAEYIERPDEMIARDLGISDGTVKVHVKNLLRKLNLRSRLEAALWALEREGAR